MAEKFYKIRESILTDVADAIRLKRNETKEYPPEDFAKLINMFVLKPVGYAFSEAPTMVIKNFGGNSLATGRSWTPVRSSAAGIANTNITLNTPSSSATSALIQQ